MITARRLFARNLRGIFRKKKKKKSFPLVLQNENCERKIFIGAYPCTAYINATNITRFTAVTKIQFKGSLFWVLWWNGAWHNWIKAGVLLLTGWMMCIASARFLPVRAKVVSAALSGTGEIGFVVVAVWGGTDSSTRGTIPIHVAFVVWFIKYVLDLEMSRGLDLKQLLLGEFRFRVIHSIRNRLLINLSSLSV